METKEDKKETLANLLATGILMAFGSGVLLMFGVVEIDRKEWLLAIFCIIVAIMMLYLSYYQSKLIWRYIEGTMPLSEIEGGRASGFTANEDEGGSS